MQIDFHHSVTYVLARLAGFTHDDARVISYAAQYVDDANNNGMIEFADDSPPFYHIASAHVLWDAGNLSTTEDREIWVPFHFLPGNNGQQVGEALELPMIKRLVCTEDSFLSQDMWRACKNAKNDATWRQRLGITTHVYADTFAHYGFVGVIHDINKVHDIKFTGNGLLDKLAGWGTRVITEIENLGHGCVFKCPDAPFLHWSYSDHDGNPLPMRDNASKFSHACDRIFFHYQGYQGKPTERLMPAADRQLILEAFRSITDTDEEVRHRQWLTLIREGRFSFGGLSTDQATSLQYVPKGKGSWKYEALNTTLDWDVPGTKFPHGPHFDQSNWKLFHQALISHQDEVLRRLLPMYKISLGF